MRDLAGGRRVGVGVEDHRSRSRNAEQYVGNEDRWLHAAARADVQRRPRRRWHPAGVPLHAAERGEGHPIVLGGGPAVANPWPLAPFFEAFFIGEVEHRLDEIVEALAAPSRARRLEALAAVPGMWLPGVSEGSGAAAGVHGVLQHAACPAPGRPGARGGARSGDRRSDARLDRGCRFCQAGCGPAGARAPCRHGRRGGRPASPRDGLRRGLTALAELLRLLGRRTGADPHPLPASRGARVLAVSAHRFRRGEPGALRRRPARLRDPGAGGGTQELRDAINKGVDDAQFEEAVRATFSGGFTGLKLYFMIGLPGETDADVAGIARMAGTAVRLAKDIARGRARLTLAVSSYVPKAHTPFQLEPFAGEAVLRHRQQLLREAMPRGVRVNFHDVATSLVEATLARGGPGSHRLVEEAWRRGARFDGWSEHFRFPLWEAAAAATAIELGTADLLGAGTLPWESAVAVGASRSFLSDERARGARGELTDDCRDGLCASCGVCGGGIEMDLLP